MYQNTPRARPCWVSTSMPSKKRGQHHGGGGIVPVRCSDKVSEDEMAPPQPHWASQKRCEKVVIWADGGDLPTQVTVDEVIS